MTEPAFDATALTKALQGQPEATVMTHGQGVIKAVFQLSDIKKDFGRLYSLTGEPKLQDAIEQAWFHLQGQEDKQRLAQSLTIYRCYLQGSLEPPTDLNALYNEARQEIDQKISQSTGTGKKI